ncbi:tRNA (adenine(58)-N(1))-methyltransferase non-catalytic subunit trm6 [Mycoemilia scoparia]|uniref:tRNA (adenine(58)-N(1))-methyltransferase non-catalytic subunit TRM6 n=1 Tax=Mycoemilia scoparia TaxID=417184 RepID=A0A9W7ZZ31_9FUNG|nr:tRNA (adenine(58)-N(1))-methyltransferase non-catalytic subunit trm6 [Mycoemilia scoparia]
MEVESNSPETTSSNNPNIIKVNDSVLIRMPSGNEKFIVLEPNTTVSLGKFGSFKSDDLVGKQYGLSFEIHDNGVLKQFIPEAFDVVDETEANNQDIRGDNQAQTLSHEEIEELKKKGLSGAVSTEEIINSITKNNQEFNKKTEYSKSKYLKRKENKYRKMFTALGPTVYNITNHFFNKNPTKTRYLRIDTLSQILSLSNVYSSSKVLLVDETQALILSSILQKIRAPGLVLALHDGDTPTFNIMDHFNFSKDTLDNLHSLSFKHVGKEMEPFIEHSDGQTSESYHRAAKRRKANHEKLAKTVGILNNTAFDSLIISTKYNPASVIKILEKHLGDSRMLVVHSPHKEALLEAFEYLRSSATFLNVNLSESWLREYQVLPGRTHPLMSMSSEGGFILTAIKVSTLVS